MSLTIAIPISDLDENPKIAIESCLNNKKYIKNVFIVYPKYKGENHNLYDKWNEHKKEFNGGIKDVSSINDIPLDNVDILVEIPPYCEMVSGDFQNLVNQAKTCNVSQTNFGLTTILKSNKFSMMHGFILVMMLIEWIISRIFFYWKVYSYHDIKARIIVKKGGNSYLAPHSKLSWYLWNEQVKRKEYGKSTIVDPSVKWLLFNNATLKFGLWILMYIPMYFMILFSTLSIIWYAWNPAVIFGSAGVFYLTEFLLVFFITRSYVHVPKHLLFCFLFPFYWIGFPVVLLCYKFFFE